MKNSKLDSKQGIFFSKKQWDKKPKIEWETVKKFIPNPIYDADKLAIDGYYHAWKLAVNAIQSPVRGSGFVSNYMFFDFNGGNAVFAHDSALMTMFGRYAFRIFKAIETLDNFYAKQHANGEICREINRISGEDCWVNTDGDPMVIHLEEPWSDYGGDWSKVKSYKWYRPTIKTHPQSNCSIDALTDHKFLWAELLNYRLTGDKKRLKKVILPLEKWYKASQVYLRDKNGLYITDWAGMDNSPRNKYLGYGVDISSQMVYRANYISEIYRILNFQEKAYFFKKEAFELGKIINEKMWNPKTSFFHDLTFEEKFVPVKTIAGFWPIFSKIANKGQIELLKKHLENPKLFKSKVMVPTLAKDEPSYTELGEYYNGGVWSYTNAMVIEGFEKYGELEFANKIAKSYWKAAVEVYKNTGTVWEYLAPENFTPGKSANPLDLGKNARADFAGWGAFPLISSFLEQIIGLRPNAENNTLTWYVNQLSKHGCKNYAFSDLVIDLVVEPRDNNEQHPIINIKSNKPFTLNLIWANGKQKETIYKK